MQRDCDDGQVCVAELCVDGNPTNAGGPRRGTVDAGAASSTDAGWGPCLGCAPVRQATDGGVGALTVQQLPLAAQDLVADPARKRVYATVLGAGAPHANQLLTLDARTGAILAAVHVGSDPKGLALTHDGASLWVGLSGAHAVRRIDLTTDVPTPAEQHAIPAGSFGEQAALDHIAALPGQPRSILFSRASAGFDGPLILDDGIPRMLTSSGNARSARYVAGEAGFLFGSDSAGDLEVVALTAGARMHALHRGLIESSSNDIVYAGGRIFARGGVVIDVSTPTAPKRAGRFGVSGALVKPVEPATPVMLGRGQGALESGIQVSVLDSATFTVKRSIRVGESGDFDYGDVRIAVQADPASVLFVIGASYERAFATYLLQTRDGLPLAAQ